MLQFIEVKMKAYDLIVDDLNAFKYAYPGERKKTAGEKGVGRAHAAYEVQQEEDEDGDLESVWNAHYTNSAAKFECVLQNHTGHNIYNCKEFLKMAPEERLRQCRGKKCFTCLGAWGAEHRRVCPGAKDLPKEVICAQCNPSGEKFPMNVLFCRKQGHKKPTSRVFLEAMKKYRPDMDVSPATEKIIKIMMAGRHRSSRERISLGTVRNDALNLRQTLVINDVETNVYYDTGAGTSLVCKSAAEELGIPKVGSESVKITNLGETVRSRVGQYQVKCTLSNQKQRTIDLQGIPDLKWDLADVNLDKVNHEVKNKKLGVLPQKVEGGAVGIVVGIDEPELMPVFLYTMPSGVAVYRSVFRDKYGSDIVYGGCHKSFTEQNTTYRINGLMSHVEITWRRQRTSRVPNGSGPGVEPTNKDPPPRGGSPTPFEVSGKVFCQGVGR